MAHFSGLRPAMRERARHTESASADEGEGMSRQVKNAKEFARGRRFLIAAAITVVAIGLGLFAGNGFVAWAAGTTTDSCGYNPAAAPSPNGGSVVFDENSVTRAIAFYGTGLSGHLGAFANDESG